ncbi:MAG: 30S ribosomal protein S12 methylthiotransferase RimO [Christensenellales bacterium]
MVAGVISLGCSKNRVDTELMITQLSNAGYEITSDASRAEIIIINTCGFITSAKEEAISTILEMSKYKTAGKCRKLIVTGCLPQRYPEELLEGFPEVDLFLGTAQYDKIVAHLTESKRDVYCEQLSPAYDYGARILTTPGETAYIRIADGCSNYCSYCAIPYIRGKFRSRTKEDILREIASLAQRGVSEFILIAQDTTRYGEDLYGKPHLDHLIRAACRIDGVKWLRVLYCYPERLTESVLDALCEHDNTCRYIDMPIQHFDAELLRRMNRRGTPDDIVRHMRALRERKFTVRTSLIVGFPGESEAQFEVLKDFIQDYPFDRLGVFAYSQEEGTPAADMENQVPEEVKLNRREEIMLIQQEISLSFNQKRIGNTYEVLVEGKDQKSGLYYGRSRFEAPEIDPQIFFKGQPAGSFCSVEITDADHYDMFGRLTRP